MGGTGSGNAFFDETAPGATGWITSENMADFMDEDGNFRMPTGATVIGGDDEAGTYDDADGDVGGNVGGAGSVRRRDEAGLDGEGGAAGAGSGDGESKWQRTS
jgi:nucleotide-sensitive chloride channel 1A